MSNKFKYLILISILVSSCGGSGSRSVNNPTQNPTTQNPGSISNLGLKLKLEAVANDEGHFLYELKMTLLEKVPGLDLKWNDPLLLGERFAVKIGESPQMLMVYNPDTHVYSTPSAMMMSGSAFRALHNKQVMVYRMDHLEEALPNFDSSAVPTLPPALASYPIVDFPPLESRIISNCVGNPGAPETIRWESFTSRNLGILFQNSLGQDLQNLSVSDQSYYQLTQNIFSHYFSQSEIDDLNDPSGGAGYGVSVHDGRMILTRSMPTRFIKVGIAKLPVDIAASEAANYGIEYQGGCR